jgi:tetratricopeptide (TPR) repeat protein
MSVKNRFKDAMANGLALVERGEHVDALKLLDEVIAEAIREHDVLWVRTLCHHAANVSRFTENWASAKRYYEQSLTSDPENARALYGLAAIALDEGDPVTARQYATRCHTSILQTDDGILKQGLVELIAKNWPDLVET